MWSQRANTKVQVSYGGYRLGANSANILVQDRITGMINEERMSVYVRLGIRLLYKGFKSNKMEMKKGGRIPCLSVQLTMSCSRLATSAESSVLRSRHPCFLMPPPSCSCAVYDIFHEHEY